MPGQGGGYERYGLLGNPFRDLSSETLDDVTIFHVNQENDATLRGLREEIYAKENRAFVAVVGPHGAGKTERLLVAQAEAKANGATAAYFDVTTKAPWVLKGVATAVIAASSGQKRGVFSSPPWLR